MTASGLPSFRLVLACALSLSIGWGIRGNFGHEYGAMIPGALAALAAVLLSGREDWWARAPYFGMFGALGWSFGGSISYMEVIAYTHSGHLPSQVYGFACLAVIGFAWGALGGLGTALPACLDRERLTALFSPVLAVLGGWLVQGLVVPLLARVASGAHRHESILYWYDTNWLAALVAIAAVLLLALVRRRAGWGTSFILHLAVGWWVGFGVVVLLVDGLDVEFRMTPPRGDNWAGVLGMTAGALLYCLRHGLAPVARAALVVGCWGGFGFVIATFLKLVEVTYVPLLLSHLFGEGAWQTNWHSILEQTYGFVNGLGVGVAMAGLARRQPPAPDRPQTGRCTEVVAVAFVLLLIPYVNLVKNVPNWVQLKAIPDHLYGLPSRAWFDAAFALLAAAVLVLLVRHLRVRVPLVPESALGKGQLLYLVFLWWVVVGNLMRAIPPFQDQRLITEGVIHVNAVLCTLLVLLGPGAALLPVREGWIISGRSLLGVAVGGLIALAVTVAVASVGTRLVYGDRFIGYAGYHTRFGPDAKTGKPQKGQDHP
jgi:hypothetical protein